MCDTEQTVKKTKYFNKWEKNLEVSFSPSFHRLDSSYRMFSWITFVLAVWRMTCAEGSLCFLCGEGGGPSLSAVPNSILKHLICLSTCHSLCLRSRRVDKTSSWLVVPPPARTHYRGDFPLKASPRWYKKKKKKEAHRWHDTAHVNRLYISNKGVNYITRGLAFRLLQEWFKKPHFTLPITSAANRK